MIELLKQPWPWYVAGAFVGLTVPALLILGNKHFGISANLRHACAACLPTNIKFFKYNWKKEMWNFFFVGGILLGAFLATQFFSSPDPIQVNQTLVEELKGYGINDYSKMIPAQIFSFENLFSIRGLVLLVGGGFLVGFGSRYAGGCTSGHSIMGLSDLQKPSLSFMVGGFIMANLLLPFIMKL
ncbi:YeeE/YedE family protein [Chitinophagaceae bacterium LB-8]|uniref:YeeE/YedE family protein n=1 Tax=Paraflavisolibacter caeni TaxID=2982496 RepID=A0A9X2XNP8_9BACT|nr:YeeE/YedE thiosulfate transporter family protein [Paraflavisolibacter caeni]MCU7549298.1 YeeE/YedE family protein [Paraflavisolibacter caeni]